ncbi:MAG: hypothetical protein JWQ24_2633 [Tardiphaga sp.]|nr:hypothetical protein [Tardiphaga sp.]
MPSRRHRSWPDFIEDQGESDFDMNLVFRWDWRKADPDGEKWGNETDELQIFFMGQRKGLYRWVEIEVTDSDEPAVKAWLEKRWCYLQLLWEGIAATPAQPSKGE